MSQPLKMELSGGGKGDLGLGSKATLPVTHLK